MHYDVGEEFRNGSFRLICRESGAAIEGCYIEEGGPSHNEILPLGESRVIGDRRHNCEQTEAGRIRYSISSNCKSRRIPWCMMSFKCSGA